MSSFYDLALKYIDFDDDRSYPSPEEQLLWRLDDLHDRLDELKEKKPLYWEWSRLNDRDIRYFSPKYFESAFDVERAIRLALDDLKNNYGIEISEWDHEQEDVYADGVEQITFVQLPIFSMLPEAV